AGHSTNGQAQAEDGTVVDMQSLDTVELAGRSARVGAGATWRSVLSQTLRHGLTPPVLTDFLGLSVGGTLSVGGMGGTSFRHGAQVDNVTELEVVTGRGTLEACSASRNPALFEAALAGLGQCGIIAAATLGLVPAPSHVRMFRLQYPDAQSMVDDLALIALSERFDQVQGIVAPPGHGGTFVIEAAAYDPDASAVEDRRLLDGLTCLGDETQSEDWSWFAWADRVAERVALLRSMGLWDHPHPWVDLFVPGDAIRTFLETALAQRSEDDARMLRILVNPVRPAKLTRLLLRVPRSPLAFLCDVLRTAPHDKRVVSSMLDRNRALFDANRALRGSHYAISTVALGSSDWMEHFGEQWEWRGSYGSTVSCTRGGDPPEYPSAEMRNSPNG
ncbi:MAG: FAD-binding protein, partial [Actinomycetota bacterium]